MNAYFYCSYNLSPVGYQEITLDAATGVQSRIPVDVKVVQNLFTHGGAKTAFGLDGDLYYLVLKDMHVIKSEVPANTPGRTWYMNYALTASVEKMPELCAVAYCFYTEYKKFSSQLAECLTPAEAEASYSIHVDRWRALMSEAHTRYQEFLKRGEVAFSDAPCNLSLEQMEEAIDLLRTRKIEGLYEFAILEGEEEYFFSSYGCENRFHLRHYIKDSNGQKHIPKYIMKFNNLREQDSVVYDLILGGAVALTVYIIYQIGRAFHTAKRKMKRFK